MTWISTRGSHGFKIAFAILLVLGASVVRAQAHAILKSSFPSIGGEVVGPNVAVTLTFNVRVDGARSTLRLVRPGGSATDIPVGARRSPDTLVATIAGLHAGTYIIQWQVLAPDGHITRGEIPFTVSIR